MNHSRTGSGLLAVLFTLALISALIGVIVTVTTGNARLAQRTADRTRAIAFGDAVIETLYDQWRQAMINVTDATDRKDGLSTASLTTKLQAPSQFDMPASIGITLQNWSVVAATPLLTPLADANARPRQENGTSSSLRVRLYYLATATIRFPGPPDNNTVTIQRAFVRGGRNVFDNFFYGVQTTEFHPGPPMYVNGTIHVNGDLFTAHDSLHFLKEVSFTGAHTLNYRPNDSRLGAPTQPLITENGLADNWDINNPPHPGQEQKLLDVTTDALDPRFMDDRTANDNDPAREDGNKNNDGYHEIIEEAVVGPDPLQLDAAHSERLANNADYRIYVDSNNNVTIHKGAAKTPLAANHAEAMAIRSAVLPNTALRDVRDGDNVRLVNLDVGRLNSAYEQGNVKDTVLAGDGITLYVKDNSQGTRVATQVIDSATGKSTSVTSNRARGIRLHNGAKLPSQGFSVVSPNAVYIMGDYNSGKTATAQPPSNTTASYNAPVDAPSPVVSGYERAAAAVVGDAVSILSNNWNDANSLLSRNRRTAANTTVNAAIVGGNVPTTNGSYSGGVENFVRFHEDWSGDYLTVYGSLALLYASQQAKNAWSLSDYSPPNRRWYYDSLLQERNPPGFQVARVYERGRRVLR